MQPHALPWQRQGLSDPDGGPARMPGCFVAVAPVRASPWRHARRCLRPWECPRQSDHIASRRSMAPPTRTAAGGAWLAEQLRLARPSLQRTCYILSSPPGPALAVIGRDGSTSSSRIRYGPHSPRSTSTCSRGPEAGEGLEQVRQGQRLTRRPPVPAGGRSGPADRRQLEDRDLAVQRGAHALAKLLVGEPLPSLAPDRGLPTV